MLRMQRLVPVRVGLVILATLFVVFNSIITVGDGQPASDAVVLALLGLFSVAILGDTARPSGVVKSSGPTGQDTAAALRRLAAEAARKRGPAPVDTRAPVPVVPSGEAS